MINNCISYITRFKIILTLILFLLFLLSAGTILAVTYPKFYPPPIVQGSENPLQPDLSHRVTIIWNWPSGEDYADIISCNNYTTGGVSGVPGGCIVENITPLRNPGAPECASYDTQVGVDGGVCPTILPTDDNFSHGEYTCNSKNRNAICRFDILRGLSHSEALKKVVCEDKYHWGIRYLHLDGSSLYSGFSDYGPINETVTCNTKPNVPTLVAPPNGFGTTSNWINYNPTFTARVSDPDGDNVRAYFNFLKVNDDPFPPLDQNGSEVSSGDDSIWLPSPDLVDGKYDWRAKAIDSGGLQSDYTDYWRVKKDTVPPEASCSVSELSGNTISISLSGSDPSPSSNGTPSGIKSGKLERRINSGSWIEVASYTGTVAASGEEYTTSISDTFSETANPGSTYEYRFSVTDGANNSSDIVNCGSVNTFDYSLSNSGNITVVRGESGSNQITATLEAGDTQEVSFSVSLPSELQANTTVDLEPLSCSPDCSTELTINTTPSTPLGDFTITVTGDPLSKTTTFTLYVLPPPNLSVSCSATPDQATPGDEVDWKADASGGNSPYSFTWQGEGVDIPDSPRVENCTPGPDWQVKGCKYSEESTYQATVTVVDQAGDSATATCSVEIKKSLPSWKEVPPT